MLAPTLIVGLAAWRFVVLARGPSPATIDMGNWLRHAASWRGAPGAPAITGYPPVVPWLAGLFDAVVGPRYAVAGLGAVAGVLLGLAIIWIGRAAGRTATAVGVAAAVASAAGAEVVAWGGFPQAIGLATGLVTVHAAARYRRGGPLAPAVLAGLATVATSHLVTAAVAAAVAVVVALPAQPARPHSARSRGLVALVALAALAAVLHGPLVLAAATAADRPRVSVAAAERILGPAWLLTVVVGGAVVALAVAGVAQRRPTTALGATALACCAGWSVALGVTGEPRYLHDGPVLAVLAGLAGWSLLLGCVRVRPPRQLRLGLAAVGLGATTAAAAVALGIGSFGAAVERYRVVAPETAAAAAWLRSATPPGSPIAVSDVGGAPLGWWVGALADRPVRSGGDLRWLYGPDERTTAVAVNRLFRSAADPTAAARALGTAYVLVVPGGPRPLTTAFPAVWQAGGAAVLAVPEPSPESSSQPSAEPPKSSGSRT
ncbi:MAG: hypothetical protein ACKO91_05065 [Acidimicrobiales bacterium]